MFSYVYLLRSKIDGEFYTGCTNDLKKRFREHNDGLSRSTKHRAPLELVYYEAFPDRKDAEKRELFFKSGWGRNYIQRTLHYYLLRVKI